MVGQSTKNRLVILLAFILLIVVGHVSETIEQRSKLNFNQGEVLNTVRVGSSKCISDVNGVGATVTQSQQVDQWHVQLDLNQNKTEWKNDRRYWSGFHRNYESREGRVAVAQVG
jgi:hypothetical protein